MIQLNFNDNRLIGVFNASLLNEFIVNGIYLANMWDLHENQSDFQHGIFAAPSGNSAVSCRKSQLLVN